MARRLDALARFDTNCVQCGNLFTVLRPSELRRGKARFCSAACGYARRRSLTVVTERFWSRVKKTSSCWLWRGAQTGEGYGKAYGLDGCVWLAHRLSWLLTFGAVTVSVLHRCDTPLCVRPTHLFQGTQTDNNADMRAKGRDYRKVSWGDVQEIRRLYGGSGATQRELARQFGVTQAQIWHIIHKKQRVSR